MAIKRVFLGWDRPLCETVPEHLLSGVGRGMQDLRGTTVVVPTRQSSWRLHAALPLAAEARGVTLLGMEIVTPPVLLEPPGSASDATVYQSLLAWTTVLRAVEPGELSAFLGPLERKAPGAGWALQVANRLQYLRKELADGGLTISAVAARGAEIEEAERWAAMAELEKRYAKQLASWKLCDPLSRKLDHARSGVLDSAVRRVVVAAIPDPPKLFMTLLSKWTEAGGNVEVIVNAPESEAAAFDDWGRPLPEAWQRGIALREEDLWPEVSPDEQAIRIREAISDGRSAGRDTDALWPQLAIGVPDRETVAPLQRELAAIGLAAFDPQNRPLERTTLFALVQALLALRGRSGYAPGYAEVAALMRHPDVLEALGEDGDVLRRLDEFQSEHLPVTLDDMDDTPPPLREAVERVRAWRETLNKANLAMALRDVMMQIYGKRLLKSDDPGDAAFRQAVTMLDEGLRELESSVAAGQDSADEAEVLIARLQGASVKAERDNERIDLEGWLELPWNPAPLLFVAGMNEGCVPDGHVGDIFLPDTLRHQLDLRDDRLRVARDAFVLTALIGQRRAAGRVILLVGKTSTAGDPLRPSRLLFRCPDTELVGRAERLFKDPPPAHDCKAFSVSFKLDPALLPAGCIDHKRSQLLSPTVFRDYLACPLRFYLKHVLGMTPVDDRAREPDAAAFGTLVHDVLKEMADDKRLWACASVTVLAGWLEKRLVELARDRYGARPWLGVQLAVDSAVQRLKAFAQKQVEWHADGWDIVQHEKESGSLRIGGLTVRGRPDRIDKNSRTGAVCVLDYKTTDKAKAPCEVHFGPPREDDDLVAACITKELAGARREKRWADLQLPLYRELVRANFGPAVTLGYVCLPVAIGETGFRLWDEYNDPLHASAVRCAEAVVQRIRDGVFWPAGRLNAGYEDDLAGVLLDDPEKSICKPSCPWGADT